MKKKLMMVAVLLGALSLGACVDDNESASVTNIRNAKAEQLTALAEKARAEGEAAKIKAEAEAALLEAQAAYQAEMTEEARQKFLVEIEKIKAEAEAAIALAKLNAQRYEQQLLDEANQYVTNAYTAYKNAAEDLSGLQNLKLTETFELTKLQSGVTSAETSAAATVLRLQNQIAVKEAQKAAWENYSGYDKSELQAELAGLDMALKNAQAAYDKAEDEMQAAQKAANEVLAPYNYDNTTVESTVPVVVAMKAYNESAFKYGSIRIDVGSYDMTINSVQDVVFSNSFELGEGTENLNWLPEYYISNTYKTIMSQYYANKDGLIEELGHEASDTQMATGYYEYLANAKENATAAKKAYDDAVTKFAELEKTAATAEDLVAEAEAAVKAAEADQKAKADAVTAAQKKVDDLAADPDATDVEKAQANLDLQVALAAKELADATYDKAVADKNKVVSETSEALNEYYNLKNELPRLLEASDAAAQNVSSWEDSIEYLTAQIEDFDTNAALWNEVVKALESEDYAKSLEALKKNETVVAYVAANEACEEAYDALNEASAAYNVVYMLIFNAYDVEEQIANIEDDIANLQEQIATAQNNVEDIKTQIAVKEAYIAYLEEQISYQEQVVAILKAALEDAIASQSGDSTDTPAEDQPAA